LLQRKKDGSPGRALVAVDSSGVTITSRPGRPHADTFPELAALTSALDGRQALLDGEIVCMGDNGKPSFDRLGTRLVNAKRARFWIGRVPATFVAFDLLSLNARTSWTGRGTNARPPSSASNSTR
jgi:bifunctional non-homologous end joining protein LigD